MQVLVVARWLRSWRWAVPLTCLVTAVAVAVPTLALAGHQGADVAEYTGCLNSGGSISNLAVGPQPKSACASSQSQVHLSGGDITKVAGSGGLQGGAENGAASLELAPSYKLPQACANGELAKWNGSAWGCASDANTTYNGDDFATSGQSCPSGKMVTGIDSSGGLVCSNPPAPSLDVKQVDDETTVPFAGPGVADARCPSGYKLVGGGWGTRDAVADGADVYDYTGGNPPGGGPGTGGPDAYDVGAATANPFGGTVYARAYCIKLN